MPPGTRPQPPAGTARVAFLGHVSTHVWVNVMYLRLTHSNPVTVNDMETILNGMADSWGTRWTAIITNNVTLDSITGVFIPSAGTSLQYTHTETKTGIDSNVIPDVSACHVINWHIGDYYRGGHPRSYLPGVRGNHVTNGSTIDSGSLTSLAAAATGFLNDTNALTSTNVTAVELGTVRYQSALAWLNPPVFKPFQSVSVRATLGSQRRRLTA